ncbi:hypothetical protein PAPYR_9719 [Paratrimastix pyriformis]|uniref:Uncharacterized protein n=1 Tax=Paratrimastix pyriformis TaxID=342808 RepID=A0ABQ8UD74_9EUKA|nr:hypothetical protein PAPYR_9719 [Paratrimastix pyriformis]
MDLFHSFLGGVPRTITPCIVLFIASEFPIAWMMAPQCVASAPPFHGSRAPRASSAMASAEVELAMVSSAKPEKYPPPSSAGSKAFMLAWMRGTASSAQAASV